MLRFIYSDPNHRRNSLKLCPVSSCNWSPVDLLYKPMKKGQLKLDSTSIMTFNFKLDFQTP